MAVSWYYGGSVALRLATFRRSRICADETCSVFRCPFVLCRTHCPPHIERESRTIVRSSIFPIPRGLEGFFDVVIVGMV